LEQQRMKQAGLQTAILSNGTPAMLDAAEAQSDSCAVAEATLRMQRALRVEGRLTRIDVVSSTPVVSPGG
jgi:hypothetical protein